MTTAQYFGFRKSYIPAKTQIIFVLESPPISGKYFYNPEGKLSEPLFRAMMKDVLELSPRSKEAGLEEFAANGCLVLDATYTPVNGYPDKQKDATILRDLPLLVETLREYAHPETSIVLVKANVCRLLEGELKKAGFNVRNRGIVIPFPSSGQQTNFRMTVRKVLGDMTKFQLGKSSGRILT